MHDVTINPNGVAAGVHCFVVDGQDISDAVQSATLQLDTRSLPELELKLRLIETPAIDTGPAVVTVPWGTKQTLELLGWTAPPDPDTPPGGDVAHADWAFGLSVHLLQGHHEVPWDDDRADDEDGKCGRCGGRWPCDPEAVRAILLEARKRLGYRAPEGT